MEFTGNLVRLNLRPSISAGKASPEGDLKSNENDTAKLTGTESRCKCKKIPQLRVDNKKGEYRLKSGGNLNSFNEDTFTEVNNLAAGADNNIPPQ